MKRQVVLLAVVSVAAMFLSACGSPGSDVAGSPGGGGTSGNTGDPDAPISSGTLEPDDGPVPEPQASAVSPNPDAVDAMPVAWDSYEKRNGGSALEIFFWSGVEPCYVLADTQVEETDQKVTVTLTQGHLETGEDVACIEIALLKSTTVQLSEPLGDRKVVDGTRG